MIIDFHTHYFPHKIAERAMKILSESAKGAKMTPYTNGTIEDNIKHMKNAGVDKMVALNIAVVPKQEASINSFVIANNSPFIIPFGSVHPDSSNWENELHRLVAAKVRGIKLHPEYQQIDAIDKRWYKIYDFCTEHNMLISMHCGYDVAFPNTRRATPQMIAKIVKEFCNIKLICAHMGGMFMWEEVLSELAGLPVYLDTSMCAGYIDMVLAKSIVNKHGVDNILYGSDLPWQAAKQNISFVNNMRLDTESTEKILGRNAQRILKERDYAI